MCVTAEDMKTKDKSQRQFVGEPSDMRRRSTKKEFGLNVVASLPVPVFVVSGDWTVEYVNRAFEETTGYASRELVGARPPYPWWADASVGWTERHLRDLPDDGPVTVTEVVRGRDEREVWVETTYVHAWGTGRSGHWVASWICGGDRGAEAATSTGASGSHEPGLAQLSRKVGGAGQLAEEILETMREPIVVLDAELRVVSANQSFYRTYMITPEKTVGRLIYDIGDRELDNRKLSELLERTLRRSTATRGLEVEQHLRGAGLRTMLLSARQVRVEDDDVKLVIVAIEDITELKRAARAAREALESVSRHESLAVLGQLAGGLGHELRNPLGAIRNAAYFLNMALKDSEPEVTEMLRILQTETAVSERIVSSLLGFACPDMQDTQEGQTEGGCDDDSVHRGSAGSSCAGRSAA